MFNQRILVPNLNTSATVGSSSTEVLGVNSQRGYVLLINDSDENMYISLGGDAVLNQGIRLNAEGGSLEIGIGQDNYWGTVNAICSSGGKNITVMELNVKGNHS